MYFVALMVCVYQEWQVLDMESLKVIVRCDGLETGPFLFILTDPGLL